jgi:hypothetical protein
MGESDDREVTLSTLDHHRQTSRARPLLARAAALEIGAGMSCVSRALRRNAPELMDAMSGWRATLSHAIAMSLSSRTALLHRPYDLAGRGPIAAAEARARGIGRGQVTSTSVPMRRAVAIVNQSGL